ncbi:hypothetical protein QBC38DRAFT_466051 [Podospora fimiseda]|uniref:Attractin/MKLN-like beta-propeller domain-containing protein n=1 Tax=Podospora fimiseda TaxID=252190 RepID=A0AAN7BXS3_9PEZI|nr:hypothetical protein QBC38DRAFT_466051 [Podospora fimiseda]
MHSIILTTLILSLTTPTLSQTWQILSSLPGPLQEHITLPLSNTQFITIGGINSNGTTIPQLLIYDIPSNTWSPGTPIPIPLNHPNAITHNNKIYLLGGLTGASQWPPSPNTFVYDPKNPSWQPLASIPLSHSPRGAAASAAYNDTIYIAGGILSVYGPTVDTVSAYHIPSNKWIELPPKAAKLPGARDHTGYAQIENKFYVLGGRQDGAENRKGDVFILDLQNVDQGWRTTNSKMPTPRGGIAAGVLGKTIYTFGGEGNVESPMSGVFDEVESYDTENDLWEKLPRMRVGRHGMSAVGIGGKVYVPGGAVRQGFGSVNDLDVFEP